MSKVKSVPNDTVALIKASGKNEHAQVALTVKATQEPTQVFHALKDIHSDNFVRRGSLIKRPVRLDANVIDAVAEKVFNATQGNDRLAAAGVMAALADGNAAADALYKAAASSGALDNLEIQDRVALAYN